MNTTGRFLSMDPLAEKYYHLSPYAYCAGDPVNLIDPDGRKIEDPNNLVLDFKHNIKNKIKAIEDNRKLYISMGVDESLVEQILAEYKSILEELEILEKSNDIFRIVNDEQNDGGEIKWSNNMVLINAKKDYGLIGHELKHAYQFTQGEISFDIKTGKGSVLYDLYDEYDAFLRQSYINSGIYYEGEYKEYLKLTTLGDYSKLEKESYNVYTKNILETLYEKKDIFRIPK